jgi:hypothetical protein
LFFSVGFLSANQDNGVGLKSGCTLLKPSHQLKTAVNWSPKSGSQKLMLQPH